MIRCPEGHASEAVDFCSVCGADLAPAAVTAPPSPAPPAAAAACVVCGTARDTPLQVFCEVCGYNFRTGAGENPRPAPAPPEPPPVARRWDVVVTVDPHLYGPPNPEAPAGHPPLTFTLFEAESIVGRGGAGVRVQVPITHDPGVSRRHAVFVRLPDGGLTVRDLGSANGTQVNGKDVVPGAESPLADGHVVAIGAWSRITLREVRS